MFGTQVISSGDEEALIQAVGIIEDDLADEMFRAAPLGPFCWLRRATRTGFAQARDVDRGQRLRRAPGRPVRSRTSRSSGSATSDLHDEILTLLLAGHHTTGIDRGVAIVSHGRPTGLMDASRGEADECLGDSGELRVEAVRRADVSATLVREVCRLYPSAWWFSREVMQPVTIGGRELKRGTSLLICPWQLQRDPRHWESPDKFLMTRRYTTDAYVPFGAGPRACAGMGVAMLELQLLALEMAAAYRFTGVAPNPAPWPKASVTLIPPPMQIDIELRQSRPRSMRFEEVLELPYVPPISAVAEALQSQSP